MFSIGLLFQWDLLCQYLILFMILDYVVGMLRSIKNKDLSSRFGWEGILRKVSIILVVLIATAIDNLLVAYDDSPHLELSIRNLVIWAYIINEIVSILENLGDLGVYLPKVLKNAIHLLKEQHSAHSNEFSSAQIDTQQVKKRKAKTNNPLIGFLLLITKVLC